MRDFTPDAYRWLLSALHRAGYRLSPVQQALGFLEEGWPASWAALRHDVDLRPRRSVDLARIERAMDVRSTYYFRTTPEAWDEGAIRAIAEMGHEVGYHYEDVAANGGDLQAARRSFLSNLERLRGIAPVTTVCMHGSPSSRWDNRNLWKILSLEEAGLHGEPYLSFAGRGVAYFTDTGRRWDSGASNVRDRLDGSPLSPYRRTSDLIEALGGSSFPKLVLVTTHPQRWVSDLGPWVVELGLQSAKNPVKFLRQRLMG